MNARRLPTAVESEFRSVLEDERRRLVKLTRQLAEDALALSQSQAEESGPGGVQADVASDLAAQTIDLSLERAERERLLEIDEALDRLSEGSYGICQACRNAIEIGRLRVLPWTRYCFQCAGWAVVEHRPSGRGARQAGSATSTISRSTWTRR